jgi:hypothetical protein
MINNTNNIKINIVKFGTKRNRYTNNGAAEGISGEP